MKLRGEEESLESRERGEFSLLGIFFLGFFPLPPVP